VSENGSGYAVAQLDQIEDLNGMFRVRKHFDVGAYGVNAYRPKDDGEVVGEHDERSLGHEELYVVLRGHAAFTLDGQEVDAPAGTLVFVRDPAVKRRAVSRDPETRILAVGAAPGQAYSVSPWEENADIFPLFAAGEYAEAKRRLEGALERMPDAPGIIYNLACAEARLGEHDAALTHLARAIELQPSFAEYAQSDDDLAAVRDDERFPA
jgi:tetratricopeptide (TPR) repeat protein